MEEQQNKGDTKMSPHKAYNLLANDVCMVGLYPIDLYFRTFPLHMSSASRVITNGGKMPLK